MARRGPGQATGPRQATGPGQATHPRARSRPAAASATLRRCALACLLTLAAPLPAQAGAIERIRSEGVLHCGGVMRPGLAFPAADGAWHGLEVDFCRAVAVAVLGPQGRPEFHGYGSPRSYDAVRDGSDGVAFLTASEILAERLLPAVVPGRAVFYATVGVLAPEASPARRVADLAGQLICGEPGAGPERALAAWFDAHHLRLEFFPFQEAEEMQDAYYAGRCAAIVGQAASLAALALQAAADGRPSRILPDVLAAAPVMANTGRQDAGWSAVVAWTVDAVLRAETLGRPGPGGGAEPDWRSLAIQRIT